MKPLTILSATEQVAEHLRNAIRRGELSGAMPGVHPLAEQLEVNHKTVRAAVRQLEREGLLVDLGKGLQRRIVLRDDLNLPALRIAVLSYEQRDAGVRLGRVKQRLRDEGHTPFYATKSQMDLGFDVRRIARLVRRTEFDAWIVLSGPRGVLEWFSEQDFPTFALYGQRTNLPIAGVGPDHMTPSRAAVRRLIELGHRRIVLIVRESHRSRGPDVTERATFEEMQAHGLPTGSYNLPEWNDTPEDYFRVLDELFRITPPTALIIEEPFLFHVAKNHLARQGIFTPEDVSLISLEPDPSYLWNKPSVAHLAFNYGLVERPIVRWAKNIARGKKDFHQTLIKAQFVEGGTVGPAKEGQ